KVDFEPRFVPVSHEEEAEDPVESLTVTASLHPRTEAVEIATPREIQDSVVQNDPLVEFDESASPSLERGSPAPLSTRSIVFDHKAAPGRRTPKSSQTPPALLDPSLETDQFQAQISFRRTTPPNTAETVVAPIEATPNQEISETEQRVTNQPDFEPEFESPTQPTYRRVSPAPPSWRDTRQQQSRRRQSLAPIESEPSINVTIGRIEVRAVPADNRKATSPRRSESPVMPLEDYLRKQRRGDR
ncbi:MAG TPA: hypothetical protein VM941_01505, partial [Pyrinomonadaceae bacterium]|nr:hypothetical protein [Pyrinomonadaceae bacterium]